ncbi:MAG: hypothetical protein ACLFR1_06700 [Spirochaetia bacterium]
MSESDVREPKVLVPFPGPAPCGKSQDLFVYLRPETNGIVVESTLLKVLRRPEYKESVKMVYLANIPGDFIIENNIVEEHYSLRLYFAVHGKKAFTTAMRERFQRFFGEDFGKAPIYGAFEALRVLKISPEELFSFWVPVYDIIDINGQLVKKLDSGCFVVNYDIPALLHKNNNSTDIAVMMLRTGLDYESFLPIIGAMKNALIDEGILDPQKPAARVFHYSKGPFEQILDGIGYLYDSDNNHADLEQLQFFCYLKRQGYSKQEVLNALKHPIMLFQPEEGECFEENLFTYTQEDTYEYACSKLQKVIAQSILSLHETTDRST